MGPVCWWGWPGHFFGGPLGMIVGVVFWAAIIYGVVYLFSRFAKNPFGVDAKRETPIDILKRRYASGEIDAEEFAKRKKDLVS
mgnify:CR=1 FL=1